jgi:hypothetical protein
MSDRDSESDLEARTQAGNLNDVVLFPVASRVFNLTIIQASVQ